MRKRFVTMLVCLLSLSFCALAAPKPAAKSGGPDKAYMQKIWDGWATLDTANVAQYYASGDRTFFDITPVKYNSWQEYQEGVKKVLAGYKAATLTVNDDAVVHPHGDLVWATATIKTDMTEQSGKRDMGAFRWTVVWEKQDGKWLIVHEHVSEPLP